MPGTTRYSATFDRPYEEEDRPASEPPNGSRRSRSQSWQSNMGGDARPYTPLGHSKPPPQRSSSTDSGTSSGTEHIPTRTVSKTAVKTHNNPFQFVKVGSCPLYRKAAEQLQKVKEVKKPEVLQEEEEEWQTNLDSWKSRRRKMSEDVFRRQEEIRQFEQEEQEQSSQAAQKKIKTFSEMVESRANRGRALSLCLISSPLELQEWEVQTNKSNSSHPFSEGSEENSAVNSEDEGMSEKRAFQKNLWSNGNDGNSLKNGSTNGCKAKTNETSYADSGLESISSSHRMGDTPDSCSDFSQDSGSSIDCDSPRVSGLLLNSVNILEDFNSKSIPRSNCEDSFTNSKTDSDAISEKEMELKGASVLHEKPDCSTQEVQHIAESTSTCADVSSDTKVSESSSDSCAPKSSSNDDFENNKFERSIESENEVFVDDFEELNTQSKVFCPKAQQTSNAIPPLKSMTVPSAPLKSNNNSEKSSCNSKKLSGATRKSGINLVKLSNAGVKINSITEKLNIFNGSKKLNNNGIEDLKSGNDVGKSIVSSDPAKSTAVNCTEKSNVCKDTMKLNTVDGPEKLKPNNNNAEKSIVNCDSSKSSAVKCMGKSNISNSTKKLSAVNGAENLKSSNDVEKSSVDSDPLRSKASNCTEKLKICKDTKKLNTTNGTEKPKICKGTKNLNTTNGTENLKSCNDVDASSVSGDPAKSSVQNCMEKSVSTNKLKTISSKEKSKISHDTQESNSVNSTQNLKSSDTEKSSTYTCVEKPESSEKFKANNFSEKYDTSSDIEKKNNGSIEKSNSNINAEKLNTSSSSTQKLDVDKKIPISESQNNEGNSVAVNEEKPKVHSEEGETKKPKNVIRRKKKRATAKIVSMEITNENINSSENQKETVVSSPQISEDSLNIVFQSSKNKESSSNMKISTSNNSEKVLLNDVPPVEKIAEEMEKLILQQLEEEERAKEMSTKLSTTDLFLSPEHNLIAPPKMAEPPKEKPPPPPVVENEAPKATPLKRVNSTKRIKKEMHKRMSNFLGIEADENGICDESSVPPPPALEQILKVEVELDKESRKRLENAAEERLRLEETEIIEKEQEIIANLETEERQRQLFNNTEICDFLQDEDRIQKLKDERKKMENERTPRLRLEEEKQLREREKLIRQQEASAEISAPVLSDAENLSNNATASNASSLCLDTKSNVSLSSIGGEGKTISNSTSQLVDLKKSEIKEKPTVPAKPEVPPKPLKKKEAIRKERERLRQEQETLQREREEHRLKLLKEQEKNNPKSYAPNAPASRLGPTPPLKPAFNPQLTNRNGPQPSTRENVVYTSQSYPGAQNGISGTSGCVEPVLNKPSKPVSSPKKAVQNDAWVQQKVSPVKKQSLESSPENKYNQNHWLIQEAEMRRIAELKERQQCTQYPIPQTHLAEDDVCSTSRAPSTMLMNPPLQEKVWSYGHSNMPVKKFPPPASAEKQVGLYPAPPQPPAKPSRVVPMERPEHMLSVSGRKRCSHCSEELGRGAAMIIESLQLYYHIHCFQCCVCQAQLGNGSCGTDVRVRNNKLHCHNCYSNDEAGLKFSQV